MKKNLFKILLCMVTAVMMVSCTTGGGVSGIQDFNSDDLIGTWELTHRTLITQIKDRSTQKEELFPGTKKNASELTYYHDGEYVNKYDNERSDSGKWKKAGELLRMTSFNSVHWGLVNVVKVTKTQLKIEYVIYGDMPEDVYWNESKWFNNFKGYNAVIYYDVYKRIGD